MTRALYGLGLLPSWVVMDVCLVVLLGVWIRVLVVLDCL